MKETLIEKLRKSKTISDLNISEDNEYGFTRYVVCNASARNGNYSKILLHLNREGIGSEKTSRVDTIGYKDPVEHQRVTIDSRKAKIHLTINVYRTKDEMPKN